MLLLSCVCFVTFCWLLKILRGWAVGDIERLLLNRLSSSGKSIFFHISFDPQPFITCWWSSHSTSNSKSGPHLFITKKLCHVCRTPGSVCQSNSCSLLKVKLNFRNSVLSRLQCFFFVWKFHAHPNTRRKTTEQTPWLEDLGNLWTVKRGEQRSQKDNVPVCCQNCNAILFLFLF